MLNEPDKFITVDGDMLAVELLKDGLDIDRIIQLMDKIEKEHEK